MIVTAALSYLFVGSAIWAIVAADYHAFLVARWQARGWKPSAALHTLAAFVHIVMWPRWVVIFCKAVKRGRA